MPLHVFFDALYKYLRANNKTTPGSYGFDEKKIKEVNDKSKKPILNLTKLNEEILIIRYFRLKCPKALAADNYETLFYIFLGRQDRDAYNDFATFLEAKEET